jgi:hypothetical protein
MTPCLAGVTCPEGTACEAERKGPLRYCVAPDEKIDAWQWAPW